MTIKSHMHRFAMPYYVGEEDFTMNGVSVGGIDFRLEDSGYGISQEGRRKLQQTYWQEGLALRHPETGEYWKFTLGHCEKLGLEVPNDLLILPDSWYKYATIYSVDQMKGGEV